MRISLKKCESSFDEGLVGLGLDGRLKHSHSATTQYRARNGTAMSFDGMMIRGIMVNPVRTYHAGYRCL